MLTIMSQGIAPTGRQNRVLRLLVMGCLALTGLLGLSGPPAHAASFEVVPIRVEFAPGQNTTTVVLRNLGDASSSVQVRPFLWSQAGDRDDLTPTSDIALSPPLFTLPPGQAQTVRLVLRNRATENQPAYRLLFDEVPPPGQPGQIVIAMRLSVPVIQDPIGGPRPPLAWTARRQGGQIALSVSNSGRRYVRLSDVTARLPDGSNVAFRPVADNPYVLPGAERTWVSPPNARMPAIAPGALLRLSAASQAGPIEQSVPLPP